MYLTDGEGGWKGRVQTKPGICFHLYLPSSDLAGEVDSEPEKVHELRSNIGYATIYSVIIWVSHIFNILGIKAADAKELKLIASQPSLKHVFNVANFDGIVDVQNEIISQVCSGVDEQLGELVSGEEGKKLCCYKM